MRCAVTFSGYYRSQSESSSEDRAQRVKRFPFESRIALVWDTLQYYDLVLVAIAASLGTGAVVGYATPVPLTAAIGVLGLVSIAFIGHALFVNGPVDGTEDLREEVSLEEVPQVLSPMESGPEP